MEQHMHGQDAKPDVTNPQSWLAVGVAVGSTVGVALERIALGAGLGLALGALGAVLSKRGRDDRPDEG